MPHLTIRSTPPTFVGRPTPSRVLEEASPDEFVPSETRHPGRLAGIALGLTMGMAALTGCTQRPPVVPIEAITPMTLETPQLMVVPDGVPRIDLYRSTTTTTSTDMNGMTVNSESDDPYSPAGTYMGAGVFADFNGNLGFVPQLAFGEKVGVTEFQTVSLGKSTGSGWFSFKPPTLTRDAAGVVKTTRLNVDEISSNGNTLTLSQNHRVRSQVERVGDCVEVRDWGRSQAHFKVCQNGNGIDVFNYRSKTNTIKRQDGTIHLQHYSSRPFVIQQDQQQITIDGWNTEVLTKTADGFNYQRGSATYSMTYGNGEIHSSHRGHTPIVFD